MYSIQPLTSSYAVALFSPAWNGTTALGWNNTSYIQTVAKNNVTNLPQPATSGQIVEVVVGAAGNLAFNPESVSVDVGTTLRFNFLGTNHTLTQSSLAHPCLNDMEFDTGFQQFNPTNASGKYLVDFKVESDEPAWFYCAQMAPKPHCQSGMVFSLNPDVKHDEFVENAKLAPLSSHSQESAVPQKFCNGTGYSPHTSMPNLTNLTSFWPSGGTVSWTLQKPTATDIVPGISNRGRRLEFEFIFAGGGAMLAIFGF